MFLLPIPLGSSFGPDLDEDLKKIRINLSTNSSENINQKSLPVHFVNIT